MIIHMLFGYEFNRATWWVNTWEMWQSTIEDSRSRLSLSDYENAWWLSSSEYLKRWRGRTEQLRRGTWDVPSDRRSGLILQKACTVHTLGFMWRSQHFTLCESTLRNLKCLLEESIRESQNKAHVKSGSLVMVIIVWRSGVIGYQQKIQAASTDTLCYPWHLWNPSIKLHLKQFLSLWKIHGICIFVWNLAPSLSSCPYC